MKKLSITFAILVGAFLQILSAQIPTIYIDGKPEIKYTHTSGNTYPMFRLNEEVGFQFTCPPIESKTDRMRFDIRCDSPGLIVRADSVKPGYFYFTATQQMKDLRFSVLIYADKPFKYISAFAKDENKPLFDTNGKLIRSNATYHDPYLVFKERICVDQILCRMWSAPKPKVEVK